MISGFRSILAAALFVPAIAAHAATVNGTIVAAGSGDPVPGARVIIASFQGGPSSSDTATTDAKGAYSFTGLGTGFKTLVASKDGFQPNSGNVNVLANNGTYTAPNIALTPTTGGGQTGAIAGTVKDNATKAAIKGATVVLSHPAGRGGATPIDTVLADAEGRFFFPVVPAANNYIVTASASGYNDATNENVDVETRDTASVALLLTALPRPSSDIIGKVTDAASKNPVPGATVILRRRLTVGGAWTPVDTGATDANGNYRFEFVAASTFTLPYSLVVSKTDYVTATSANIVVPVNETDTVNVALVKVAKGSLIVFVGRDTTGYPHLEGAHVTAILDAQDGGTFTGTTDHNGIVIFPSVTVGTYSVSASLAGYVSKVVSRTVSANGKDTARVNLIRATNANSKTLSGIVRDGDGKAVAGAQVIFEANGANGVTVSATSNSTGDYSIPGIPVTVTGGSLTVTKSGFGDFTGAVTLGSQASFFNVTLKSAVGILASGRAAGRLMLVNDGSGLAAAFAPSASAGTLSLYDLRGSLRGAYAVPAGAFRATLRTSDLIGARVMVLRQGSRSHQMALPAGF